MAQYSNGYIVGFAAAVCTVCGLFVSSAAVSLKEKQQENALFDLQKNIVSVSGLSNPSEELTKDKIAQLFDPKSANRVEEGFVDLESGAEVSKDKRADAKADSTCLALKDNPAQIKCLPKYAKLYTIYQADKADRFIIEVEGKGLWSTMKGFLAIASNGNDVLGITFYSHGETPGLGGEIDNPNWKKKWEKLKAFDGSGNPQITVTKGAITDDTKQIASLSGATLTSNGVDKLAKFWLSDKGYGKFLKSQGGKK